MNWKEEWAGLQFIGALDEGETWLKDGQANKGLSRNYKQGYRIYTTDGIGPGLTSRGGGIAGEGGGLYIVKRKVK